MTTPSHPALFLLVAYGEGAAVDGGGPACSVLNLVSFVAHPLVTVPRISANLTDFADLLPVYLTRSDLTL